MRQRTAPASPDHPLGYGKAIYFWCFLVAVMLFSVGGLFSIYEGVHKLQASEPLQTPGCAVGMLVFGIVAEASRCWGCLHEVAQGARRPSLWQLVPPQRARASCW